MKARARIIAVILILFPVILKSQITLVEHLQWTEPKSFQLKNGRFVEKFYRLNFVGSQENSAYRFPYYIKVLDLPYYGHVQVSFEKKEFKVYDGKHKIFASELLPKEIKIISKVYLSRGKPKLILQFVPVERRGGRIYLLENFEMKIRVYPLKIEAGKNKEFKAHSVLATGRWYKLGIVKDGIYKISFDQLKQWGFSDPSKVRVFNNNFGQLPYYNNQYAPDDLEEDYVYYGSNYIMFFARGASIWQYNSKDRMFERKKHDYSDTAYVFLTDYDSGLENVLPMEDYSQQTPDTSVETYLWYGAYEKDLYNFLHSGRMWFGNPFYYSGNLGFTFSINGVVQDTARVKVQFLGRNFVTAQLEVYAEQSNSFVTIPKITGYVGTDWGRVVDCYLNYVPTVTANPKIYVKYYGNSSSSRGFLDYIEVNYYRCLDYQGFTEFSNLHVLGKNYVRYDIGDAPSDLQVWDVTDPCRPVMMKVVHDGASAWFVATGEKLHRYVMFSGKDLLLPVEKGKYIGLVANQDLHGTSANTDMIIVSAKKFYPEAKALAQLHEEHDGINVKVVTAEQVYNEFSSGIPDAVAIRNYMRCVYQKPGSRLKWLLLFGDGSFQNRYAPHNPNYLPTYQTKNSLNTNGFLSMTSDDFFALLDDNEGELNGLMDIDVGRLPVETAAQAQGIVNKIKAYLYSQDRTNWKDYVTFVADDGNNGLFMSDAENIANRIYSEYPQIRVKKIYIDAYNADISFGGEAFPGAVDDIKNMVENGTMILSYLGHGNENVLASERVITSADVRRWTNLHRLNVFVVGTCEFGRFDFYDYLKKANEVTGGEWAILNSKGGSIEAYVTTRISYSSINYFITRNFFHYFFLRSGGKKLSFGQIVRLSKTLNPSYFNHVFVLLGDPALYPVYPDYTVKTLSIAPDTLKGLSFVKVSGIVTDTTGKPMVGFNGKVYVTVLDKPQYYWTLNNDLLGAFKYLDYKNILFKGVAQVRDGEFSFEFYVPKDVVQAYGNGKIIYYAVSDNNDAYGATPIIAGGMSLRQIDDHQGPRIKLYLNDTLGVKGSITDRNPKILAYLWDQTGINTTASGLGHELQLILDGKQKYVVNEYFTNSLNKNNSGWLKYQLYKLPVGEHTVKLMAFDVLNNYSEKTISFKVTNQEHFIIARCFNYPNPFVNSTDFYFEHNQQGENLTVILQIFSVSGRLVKTLQAQIYSKSFLAGPIHWDGTDSFGHLVATGPYFYILTVRNEQGKIAQIRGKILKL